MGSTVKFRVRMGAKFAENPVLLVNLPQQAQSDLTTSIEEESKEVLYSQQPVAESDSIASIGGSGDTLTSKPMVVEEMPDLLK